MVVGYVYDHDVGVSKTAFSNVDKLFARRLAAHKGGTQSSSNMNPIHYTKWI